MHLLTMIAKSSCPFPRLLSGVVLVAAASISGGCSALGFLAQPFKSEDKPQRLEAQYTDFEGKRVAVMVSVAGDTVYRYRRARPGITTLISRQLAEHVEPVRLMNPEKIIDYQVDNPYWDTLPYSQVIEALDVDRLILVDLVDYRTHKPGNPHLYRGLISANVGVLEAEAENPDDFAFRTQVRARYPRNAQVGLVNADEQTIELATIKRFSIKASQLFYEDEQDN